MATPDVATATDADCEAAQTRTEALRQFGYALSARYDRRRARVIVEPSTGVQLATPAACFECIAGATPDALANIEINPAGVGLYWPQIDADLYLPALLQGVFGSRHWMAAQLGSAGGQARSPAKAAAARANGCKGGRPPAHT